ncbi:MAG TPA: DUF2142 domain-containing protein, partial [Solirubrobacterales bacterium]|nr:DUF2142 domain-containing protein [Solirubrobacterales bacterium]
MELARQARPAGAVRYREATVSNLPRSGRVSLDERLPPHRVYLVIGGLGALLLSILTPPFEVPDEPQHLYRIFQLSELELWGSVRDGTTGTRLPSSLPELVEHFLGTRANHAARPLRAHPWRDTWAQLTRPLDPERREFVPFVGSITYPPFAYAPQVLAVALMRTLGAPPLLLLYAARLANALVAVALLAWALRAMPVGREAALVVALFPMSQFLVASASQDAITLASALVLTAIGLSLHRRSWWSGGDLIAATVAGTALCAAKPFYLPLLLVG